MADYNIQNSNGSKGYTIPSKDFNKKDTDLIFIGENALKYGTALQQDLINLLSNFYAITPEFFNETSTQFIKDRAIPGQLIYDGTDLLICTAPNTLEKLSLSPIKPSLTFIINGHKPVEDPFINGKINGYIQIVSSGISFKPNIEELSNIITINNVKNANNQAINLIPIVNYIKPNSIAITFQDVSINDANINQGELIINDAAFNYVPPTPFNKSYKLSDNPINMFPTVLPLSYPKDLTILDKFHTLEYININDYQIFINLSSINLNDGYYFIVKDNVITDINSLYTVADITNLSFFNGLSNEFNQPYTKPKLISYDNMIAGIFTDNVNKSNKLIEFKINLDGKLVKHNIRSILPSYEISTVRTVKLLSKNTLIKNVNTTINICNLSNNAEITVESFQANIDDPLSVYNLIDVIECSNIIYFVWSYDNKITITDKSLTRIFPDTKIMPTSLYKDNININPYSYIIKNNSNYIVFVTSDNTNLKLMIFKGSDKSINAFDLGLLSSFNTNLTIEDVILNDNNSCIIITNDPKVMKIEIPNVETPSKTVNELYTVVDGKTTLSTYGKSQNILNDALNYNIIKVFGNNMLNIF